MSSFQFRRGEFALAWLSVVPSLKRGEQTYFEVIRRLLRVDFRAFEAASTVEAHVSENRKTIGAVVGALGAQVLVIGAFLVFGEGCCLDQFCVNDDSRCLFGMEMFAYWASVGTFASAVCAVLGALIAGDDG
jgi:hypothetical protein